MVKASRTHISLRNTAGPTLEGAQAAMLSVRLSGFKSYLCHFLPVNLELPELTVSLSLGFLMYELERNCGD